MLEQEELLSSLESVTRCHFAMLVQLVFLIYIYIVIYILYILCI